MGISGRISGSGLPSCGCILQEKICGDYWEGSQLLWCFCNYGSCFVGSFLSSCFLFTGLHNCAWPARPVSSSFELLQMLQLACTVKASAASANLVLAESIFGLYQKLSSNTMAVMRIMQYEYYCTMFQTFFFKKKHIGNASCCLTSVFFQWYNHGDEENNVQFCTLLAHYGHWNYDHRSSEVFERQEKNEVGNILFHFPENSLLELMLVRKKCWYADHFPCSYIAQERAHRITYLKVMLSSNASLTSKMAGATGDTRAAYW